jgi:hypothetical protein
MPPLSGEWRDGTMDVIAATEAHLRGGWDDCA